MNRLFPILLIFGITQNVNGHELPIKSARTVSFTTEEGSYMNIPISTDGKTILFDLSGDIYSIPARGGNSTQLTRGMNLNQCSHLMESV